MSTDTNEFDVSKAQTFAPTVPDAVVKFCLRRAGFECNDPAVGWLVAVAAQRFALDIAHNAKECHDLRAGVMQKKVRKAVTLSMEDLSCRCVTLVRTHPVPFVMVVLCQLLFGTWAPCVSYVPK